MILTGDEDWKTLVGYIASSATTEELQAFLRQIEEGDAVLVGFDCAALGTFLIDEAARIVESRLESGVLK